MCGTHNHGHGEGHAQRRCGHCKDEHPTLEKLKNHRDELDRQIAELELDRADADRFARRP